MPGALRRPDDGSTSSRRHADPEIAVGCALAAACWRGRPSRVLTHTSRAATHTSTLHDAAPKTHLHSHPHHHTPPHAIFAAPAALAIPSRRRCHSMHPTYSRAARDDLFPGRTGRHLAVGTAVWPVYGMTTQNLSLLCSPDCECSAVRVWTGPLPLSVAPPTPCSRACLSLIHYIRAAAVWPRSLSSPLV